MALGLVVVIVWQGGAEVENGHTDGYAVRDLVEDNRAGGIGEFGVDFNAAIDRAGVHDEGGGLEPSGALSVEAEHSGVLAEGGEVGGGLAFVLNAEEEDGVGVGEGFSEVVGDFGAEGGEVLGNEGGRAGEGDDGTEFLKGGDVGASNAAEEDVAEDGYLFAVKVAEVFTKGKAVEEGLCGMGVSAISSVDDGDVDDCAEVGCRTGGAVADDDRIGIESLDVASGVAEGLAFGKAAGVGSDGDDVGAEAFGGDFEGDARARAWFHEEIDNGSTAQSGQFFLRTSEGGSELLGYIEKGDELFSTEVCDADEVFMTPRDFGGYKHELGLRRFRLWLADARRFKRMALVLNWVSIGIQHTGLMPTSF